MEFVSFVFPSLRDRTNDITRINKKNNNAHPSAPAKPVNNTMRYAAMPIMNGATRLFA
jgi:hypothetical protein